MTIRGRRCWDCRRLDSTSRHDSTSISHGMTRARRAVRFAWVTTLLLVCPGTPAWSAEPPVLLHASPPSKAVVTLPGGDLSILYMVSGQHCASIRSGDGGATWSKPRVEFEFRKPAGVPVVLVDQEGELHAFLLVRRGGGRTPTVDYFYDIWHAATRDGRTRWSRPQRIFEGYVGALNGVVQLENGRIVLPHQFWVPGLRSEPPTGSHVVTTSYTGDGGRSWRLSPARLTSPCRSDYIGSNYGATEPVATQLRDGRVWMLIRTQTGFLYESFSPDGIEWSEARPTRFRSSNSPANLLRLPDGRLVVFWNNCENPSRVDGEPVYTTRDALHVAISADEGHTWAGYREAFRDPNRNQSPPRRGDRGTAYPFSRRPGRARSFWPRARGRAGSPWCASTRNGSGPPPGRTTSPPDWRTGPSSNPSPRRILLARPGPGTAAGGSSDPAPGPRRFRCGGPTTGAVTRRSGTSRLQGVARSRFESCCRKAPRVESSLSLTDSSSRLSRRRTVGGLPA